MSALTAADAFVGAMGLDGGDVGQFWADKRETKITVRTTNTG
jgi:hypothetical protein